VSAVSHRVLVTGGAGFIGSNFIRRHLLESEEWAGEIELIVCLDKLSYAGNRANLAEVEGRPDFIFVCGDIGDSELVATQLERHRINGIVHLAAESHVDRSIDAPEIFVEVNVLGTLRLLEAAGRYWSRLTPAAREGFRFVHVSTDEVFGALGPDDPACNEQSAYAPNSPYAASKAGGDHLVRAWHRTYGFPAVIAHAGNNYGPYQFPEKLIPLMLLNALEEKPLPIYSDGAQVRDWLYVDDHARALRRVLEAGRPGEVYAIGGGNQVRNLDLVQGLCALLDEMRPRGAGRRYEELVAFVQDRPGHDRRYALNSRKIESELGWQPREDFAAGLRKTAAWYLAHLDWCHAIEVEKYQRERLGLKRES
jgi:dTDP-glucose 4,6-dehydratase